jgi:nitrogen regulatory protein P-II 1
MLSIVTAVIKPHMVEPVKEALKEAGVTGITLSEVKGFGRQGGHTETYRGAEYQVDFVPKVKVEVLVPSDQAEGIASTIASAANTGAIGDGKIWHATVDGVMRVRTLERGVDAI